ncbi:DOMON domain-containing protein [Meloidogyne graminicola]|uniref:DOMON domain-containing protein n=1 Tax=Meloidogyne graminicola TaxID=189291 RepID=A0A8T0A237_9BILA|nr:DOMON domain-containing protein [Meloidogyne graminicola]
MFNQINYSLFYLIFPILFPYLNSDVIGVDMDRNGCGETKGCLFRPNGCDPMLDCTIAIVFTISGRNQLYIQMTAQSLYPPPSLQYIAIGFSHDKQMGDDFVSECVLSPDGSVFSDVEVYPSYNLARSSNERTLLSPKEHSFNSPPIFSPFQNRSNLIWNLDKSFWVMGATGSAQPDGIKNSNENYFLIN